MQHRSESWSVGQGALEVRDASIVDVEGADVYVSPDDNYLSHGGGASAAIWRAAGPALASDVEASRCGLGLGDTLFTTGGRLGAWIWHAVTLDLDANRRLSPADAQRLWGRVVEEVLAHLRDAAGKGYTPRGLVVTPLLGAGVGGLGAGVSALALLRALMTLSDLSLFDVRLVVTAMGADYAPVARIVRDHVEEIGATRLMGAPAAWVEELAQGVRLLLERTPGGKELAPRLDRLPLGELVNETVRLRAQAGQALAPSAVHALSRAVEARNRLIHGGAHVVLSGTGPLLADVRDGLAALRRAQGSTEQAALFPASPSASDGQQEGGVGNEPPRPAPSARSEARPPPPIPTSAPPIRADPVRLLRDFLLANLPADALEDYVRHLRTRGFVGEDALCVLEACVVEEDPVALLCDLFSARDLRRCLQREYAVITSDRDRGPDIARELLRAMGFPVAGTSRGVEAARDLVARMRTDLPAASYLEIRGAVSRVASELEYVVLVLLRFVADVAFRRPADLLATERKWLEPTLTLDRCSLGKLLALLERLGRALEEGDEPGIAEFRRNFRTDRLAPEGAQGIAALRNRFAHYDRELATYDLETERRSARDFYDQVDAFLAHLVKEGERVFPHLVVVDRIVVDCWGRRVVHASGERHRPERIYTARELAPGEVYFMHPLTNPLRVDPILVAAGDLGRRKRHPPVET